MTSEAATPKPARFSLFWSGVGAFCVLSILACHGPDYDRYGRMEGGGAVVAHGIEFALLGFACLLGFALMLWVGVRIVRARGKRERVSDPLIIATPEGEEEGRLQNVSGLVQTKVNSPEWIWRAILAIAAIGWTIFWAMVLWGSFRNGSIPKDGELGSPEYPIWHQSEAEESPWWLREISIMGYEREMFEELADFPLLEKLYVESPMSREWKDWLQKSLPDVEIIFCDDPKSEYHHRMSDDDELKAIGQYYYREGRLDLVEEIARVKREKKAEGSTLEETDPAATPAEKESALEEENE